MSWVKRRWIQYLILAPVGALGLVSGLAALSPSLANAPAIKLAASEPFKLPQFTSVAEMVAWRDRLQSQLDAPSDANPVSSDLPTDPRTQIEALQAIEIQIQLEETGEEKLAEATRLATEATALGKQAEPSKATIETIYTAWQQAVDALESVPQQSLSAEAAAQKLESYQKNLEVATYAYDTSRSDFLEAIAESTGLPAEDVHITVCHIDGDCRRWQGNVPPASPASLIKMPIAIALMNKLHDENISVDTKILVTSGNYTEDASDIWVRAEYPLRKLVTRMINQSSNIATNQLIDYLGRSYINKVMRDRGYTTTFVDYKLVGESTYPSNAGSIPNKLTTDELTEMMRQIYRQEHPGDDLLIEALASQYDLVLGSDGIRNTKAIWLGEKTGQNSKALGTTLAFTLEGQVYVASIVLDYSGNERAVRSTINQIVKYITERGQL